MSVDTGFFSDCYFHAVCGGIVIPGQDVCDTCRTAWGQLLRPVAANRLSVEGPTAGLTNEERPSATPTIRSNQTCWLCEQRRKCVLIANRWECADCHAVTG